MIRLLLSAARRSTARVARYCSALGLASVLLLLAGQLPAYAGSSPSPSVVEHLVAQAGLSIGFGWNLLAQFFMVYGGIGGIGCQPTGVGASGSMLSTVQSSPPSSAEGVDFNRARRLSEA